MNRAVLTFIFGCFFVLPGVELKSQCEIHNSFFREGESLTYDLYYKYGLIDAKAGFSSLSTIREAYNGENAYKMTLRANSSGVVKSFFSLSDTISSYMTRDLVPLAYNKNAHENGDYITEHAEYTYTPEGIQLRNINIRNGNLRYDTTLISRDCMYDMLSIIYYVRALNYTTMKKGDKVTVSFFSGKKKLNMDIEHHGFENVKANNKVKYNCIRLVLVMNDKAFEDKDETMKVFLSNDPDRLPIRIDSKLKVGSTRIILKTLNR